MKVLMINCTNRGSVGKIMNSVSEEIIRQNGSVLICHGLGDATNLQKNILKTTFRYETGISRRISYVMGLPYAYVPISTRKMLSAICNFKPDIVHVHCPNGSIVNVYQLIKWLKEHDYPVVVTNHCEMFYTANCPHSYECEKWVNGCYACTHLKEYVGPYMVDRTAASWKKMAKAFEGFRYMHVVSVSNWVYQRSTKSAILGRFPNSVIENGINEQTYRVMPEIDTDAVKQQYGLDISKQIVLFVTAHFSLDQDGNKGGYHFVELANQLYEENIQFVVVGSKERVDPLPSNMLSIGRVENESELAKLYNVADLTIVLSKKETFSMPCAESLCSGTPVVGFRAGGPESISLQTYSAFAIYGDVNHLSALVKEWSHKKHKEFDARQISDEAHKRYGEEHMVNQYIWLYKKLMQEKGSLKT